MVKIKYMLYMALSIYLFPITLWANISLPISLGDTNKVLPPLQVIGLKYPSFFSGTKFQLIDSVQLAYYQQQNLANLLGSQSQLFIKNYGPGGLSTPGFRGGNANHTLVLWNGISLQSALSGQTDFTLIPAFLLNHIAIQYGSASVLFGSGAIGGVVHVQTSNKQLTGNHLQIMSGVASYGTYTFGLKFQTQGKRWQLREGLFYQKSKNNFAYHKAHLLMPGTPIIDSEISRQSNADFNQISWVQELDIHLGKHQMLGLRSWITRMDRNLPNPQGTSPNYGHQTDKQFRFLADYKINQRKAETNIRTALQREILWYSDIVSGYSDTQADQLSVVADQMWQPKNFVFLLSGSYQYLHGSGLFYTTTGPNIFSATQWRAALFGSIKHSTFNGKLQQQIGIRQEQVDGQFVPLMPSYGVQWLYKPYLTVLASVARTYRLPTLNDLYWPLMGNTQLLPEQGWNYELSTKSNIAITQNLIAKLGLTAYYKLITNWILWVPTSINLSSPMNVHQVQSKGVELQWDLVQQVKKINLHLSGLHDVTLAVPTSSNIANDASLQKQLIYTPGIKHQLNVQLNYQRTSFQYTFTYTGLRFTASDNSAWLEPYTLSMLQVTQLLTHGQHHFTLSAGIHNIGNVTYQIMANRAMPLRNYQITLIYTI